MNLGVLLALLLPVAIVAQQRDTQAPAAAATGEISGTVVSAENNAEPLRRAVVTVTGGGLNPRSVLTDDAGRFNFTRLPGGTYSVTARKAAYLAAPFGAKRPGRTGMRWSSPARSARTSRSPCSVAPQSRACCATRPECPSAAWTSARSTRERC
jgi:hypothetical protein